VARGGVAEIKTALASIDEAELIELTRELVRIPSVVRPGDPTATEAAVARYIEAWLTKEGFDLEVQEVARVKGGELLRAVAGDQGEGGIHGHDGVGEIGDQHAVPGRLDDAAVL